MFSRAQVCALMIYAKLAMLSCGGASWSREPQASWVDQFKGCSPACSTATAAHKGHPWTREPDLLATQRTSKSAQMALRASSLYRPSYLPALAFRAPSSCSRLMEGKPAAWPISKSVGSWPGVIFRTPEPKSLSTFSLAMMGMRLHKQQDLEHPPYCTPALHGKTGHSAAPAAPHRCQGVLGVCRAITRARRHPGHCQPMQTSTSTQAGCIVSTALLSRPSVRMLPAITERHCTILANEVLVAGILGMHSHSCVPQYGFWTGGGDRQVPPRGVACQGVLEVVQLARLVTVLHLHSHCISAGACMIGGDASQW